MHNLGLLKRTYDSNHLYHMLTRKNSRISHSDLALLLSEQRLKVVRKKAKSHISLKKAEASLEKVDGSPNIKLLIQKI